MSVHANRNANRQNLKFIINQTIESLQKGKIDKCKATGEIMSVIGELFVDFPDELDLDLWNEVRSYE